MRDQSIQGGGNESSVWSEFQKRNSGHRFLKEEALYSLPKNLISAINTGIPGFFSESDLKFENDLSELTKDGFFLGKPLDFFPNENPINLNQNLKDAINQIKVSIGELRNIRNDSNSEMLKIAQPSRSSESRHEALEKRAASDYSFGTIKNGDINDRLKSYIGWLCLDANYLGQVQLLKEQIFPVIKKYGGFHKFELELVIQRNYNSEGYLKAKDLLNDFYCEWNLNSFYTWDMPEPIEPSFSNGFLRNNYEGQKGIHIFLPWYCVKGMPFNINQKIRSIETSEDLGNFISFFEMEEKKGKEYYKNLYTFYRYFYLSIYKRYKAKINRNLQKFDTLLNCLFHIGADSVSRIRKDFYQTYTGFGLIER